MKINENCSPAVFQVLQALECYINVSSSSLRVRKIKCFIKYTVSIDSAFNHKNALEVHTIRWGTHQKSGFQNEI